MTWFEQLEIHLRDIYLNNPSYVVDAFKLAFCTFFGKEHHTFRLKMFYNPDQLRLQLERENLHEVNAKTCLEVLRTRRDLLENLDTLEAVIHRAVITYGILRMKETEVNALKINPVQAVDDSLIVLKTNWIKLENNNALNKSVNETQLHQHESLVTESTTLEDNLNTDVKALDAGSVITESSGTKSDKHDTSSRSGNYITHAMDADIRPHTEQSEPIYDTYLLKNVDSNTTPNSTNMCHRGGEIDQDAKQYQVKSPLLNAEFFKMKDMVEKEVYNELSNRFLQLEKYCISLENFNTTKGRKNSQKESYGSNDMDHNHYLEEARKKTQERNRNLKSSVMHTTSLQITTNGSKQKPRSNNQTSRSLPVSKSNGITSNSVPLVDHSRNSSSFSDSKNFVCSTCQKCVFNANHDVCLTKFLKEVNSRIKVQSSKTRNSIKPVEMITNVIKPKRWIFKGYMISPNKSSIMHEKPNTPRSYLRWKPTGRIFKIAGLRLIPTGKLFTDSTTKVDSEPPNGSYEVITNPCECDQTLNVSAVLQTSPNVDHQVLEVPTPVLAASTSSPSSTTVDQDAPSTSTSQNTSEQQSSVIPQGVEDDFYDIEVAHINNDPYFGIPSSEPSSEETTLQGVIPSNLHHLNHD
ncbi:hypothetical protein Tco_1459145 [Tanacetum coccineum]